MYQCFLYMRHPDHSTNADGNHYAIPIPISPVISTVTMKVIRIDILPTGADEKVQPLRPWKPIPCNEYLPEYQHLRKDLKPLNVVQPEGTSFKVTEGIGITKIEWQKWHMQVAFNQREGMVLYDVCISSSSECSNSPGPL
jgi:primary-amine oxidase